MYVLKLTHFRVGNCTDSEGGNEDGKTAKPSEYPGGKCKHAG